MSDKISSYVLSFGRQIMTITINLSLKYPNDPFIYRAKNQILLAVDHCPIYVINTVGYYLYGYKELIIKMEDDPTIEDFFLNNTYDEDVKNSQNLDNAELVKFIIPKLQDCAKNMPSEERNQYKNIIINLLYCYIDYKVAVAESQALRTQTKRS